VAAAKVTVTNPSTQVSYDALTNNQGFYRVNELPPGKYKVTVEATGFKTSSSEDVVVEAEQPRGFDVTLQVGTASEVVTVLASEVGLQTENASVSGTLDLAGSADSATNSGAIRTNSSASRPASLAMPQGKITATRSSSLSNQKPPADRTTRFFKRKIRFKLPPTDSE